MNLTKLAEEGINVKEGIDRFAGHQELYEKYLLRFPSETVYQEMCEAIHNKDVTTAFKTAHTLKGVLGNLSMTKMYNDILPLVEELRAGNIENADALLIPVQKDYDQIIALINGLER